MKISVKVIPRSSKNSIEKIDDKTYKVKLTAAPTDGKANEQLIKLLAEYFTVSKSNVSIVKGQTSPKKIVEII